MLVGRQNVLCLAWWWVAACNTGGLDTGGEDFEGCRNCHGSTRNAAPPGATSGATDTAQIGVGGHQTHLLGGQFSRPVSCSECHLVPTRTHEPGHVDSALPAETKFGPLATGGGALQAVFDRTERTCRNYCHGALFYDGGATAPVWTVVNGTQAACGACHGTPPAGDHPADHACELCHLPTAGPDLTIASRYTHVDGVLQVSGGACSSCHGDDVNAAPPYDTDGDANDPTTDVRVGAHQTHLAGGASAKPVACSACHVVPTASNDAGHMNDSTPGQAEVIARTMAGQPAWDHNAQTCADTYCHASGFATHPDPASAIPAPQWTLVGTGEAQCGACHGLPPATRVHQNAQATDCSVCHLPTAGPSRTIARRDLHVDGVLQMSGEACNTCHGDAASAAPPLDLAGDTAPTDPQVGAHRAHLAGGQFSAPVPCDTCHQIPFAVDDIGHVDSPAPAEITFSGRATALSSAPLWSPTALTCADTYCHGGSSSAGVDPVSIPGSNPSVPAWNPEPVWHAPGTIYCGSCHGFPPDAPHPQSTRCGMCHAPVVDLGFDYADPIVAANPTVLTRSSHVDGAVTVTYNVACTACHGTAGGNAAPPADLSGDSAPGDLQVGAHQAHLAGGSDSRSVACAECHLVPNRYDDPGHLADADNLAELVFGALARAGGATPSYTLGSCANYCHGATLSGGSDPSPAWTGTATTCTSCHGMPPATSVHTGVSATSCDVCHDDAGAGGTIVDPTAHVDGVVQAQVSCSACHGDRLRPGPDSAAPPVDLSGATSSPQVGAHLAHLNATLSAPVPCATCHGVPQSFADPGHVDNADGAAELTLRGRATNGGASAPTYALATHTCSAVYCHGDTLAGGANGNQVVWGAGAAESQCDACHGMPPPTPGHQDVQPADPCGTCHEDSASATDQTIAVPLFHVDGTVQVSACGSACHEVPPTSGAHTAHAATLGFECAVCHGNNGSGPAHNEGNGTVVSSNVDVVFRSSVSFPGGTSMNNGGTASYNATAKSCRVGCHNPRVGNPAEAANLAQQATWAAGALSCVLCHDTVGVAPPLNHALGANVRQGCETCHDLTAHTAGLTRLKDPDPTDSYFPSLTNPDALCKTCHDGTTTPFFGGVRAVNALVGWTASAHAQAGLRCADCHTYHVSTGYSGWGLVERSKTGCMGGACHSDLYAAGGPFSYAGSHHKVDETGATMTCSNCHNPMLSQASPRAAVSPDNVWQIYEMPVTAVTGRRSAGDYRGFCLACHDGQPPAGVSGAKNIAAALSGGTEPSQFKDGGTSLHRSAHGGYNCQNCHDWHGTNGTQGINRGRMLLNYMNVTNFPYTGENSCGTANRRKLIDGVWVTLNFGCH